MKNLFIALIAILVFAQVAIATPNTGAIWTTRSDCGVAPQNENHYDVGDVVYINGDNFNPDLYDWDITGQPGGASCDPDIVVASGTKLVDESGAFCFEAYTVQNGDCGEYKATVGNKHDNYRINDVQIPEFGVIGATIALTAAIAGFVIIRRKK